MTPDTARADGGAPVTLDQWNQALFQELLPIQPEPERPVLLACDDETVRAAAKGLGIPASDGLDCLIQAMKSAHGIYPQRELGGLTGIGGSFRAASRPRPIPPFFGELCLFVLAASRMSPEETRPTNAYHPILRSLLNCGRGIGEMDGFWYVEQLFPMLAEWLRVDLVGRHGRLILPDTPKPKLIGWPISQTVFRERDREVLTSFFHAKLRQKHEGIDRLRVLRRWGGRHQLTHHARDLLMDDAVSDLVRAAIDSAYRSWDGAILESEGRRAWPARLRLEVDGPRLLLSTINGETIRLRYGRERMTLYAGGDVVLPSEILRATTDVTVSLPIEGTDDSVRIPALGSTVFFQVTHDAISGTSGLWRVTSLAEDGPVWVLTSDRDLAARLGKDRDPFARGLPEPWVLLQEVAPEDLPASLRQPTDTDAAPIVLEGGLPLDRLTYLMGGGPDLAAGTFDDGTPLPVVVDGIPIGLIRSNGRCPVPATKAGHHRVVVGDGLYIRDYEVAEHGDSPPAYSELRYELDHSTALKRGAVPLRQGPTRTISGALMDPPPPLSLPIMRSSRSPVFTISAGGEGHWFHYVGRPGWLSFAELKGADRWEIPDNDVAWVVCPRNGTVLRWRATPILHLDEGAADVVMQLGADVIIDHRHGPVDADRLAWAALLDTATEVAK